MVLSNGKLVCRNDLGLHVRTFFFITNKEIIFSTNLAFHSGQRCFNWFNFFMLQKLVWFSCPKKFYLFECLRGTLVISKVLGDFFVSSETVSYPNESVQKFQDMEWPYVLFEDSRVLSLYRNFEETFFKPATIKIQRE